MFILVDMLFVRNAKKKLNDFAAQRLAKYEKKLVDAFIND